MLNVGGPADRYSASFAQWSGLKKTIEQWNSLDEYFRARFEYTFEAVCKAGSVPPTQREHIRDGIWEYKARRKNEHWRAMAFLEGRIWCVTHFFLTDHSRRMVNAQCEKAIRARSEHLEGFGQ